MLDLLGCDALLGLFCFLGLGLFILSLVSVILTTLFILDWFGFCSLRRMGLDLLYLCLLFWVYWWFLCLLWVCLSRVVLCFGVLVSDLIWVSGWITGL